MAASTVVKKELHLIFTDTSKEEVNIVVAFPKKVLQKLKLTQ